MKVAGLSLLILSLALQGFAQTGNSIQGKWIEIRSEFDNGSIYHLDSTERIIRKDMPGLWLDFNAPDSVLIYSLLWRGNEPKHGYVSNTQDSIYFNVGNQQYHVINQRNKNLLVLGKSISNPGYPFGQKKIFLRKELFDKMSTREQDSILASRPEDDVFYNKLITVNPKLPYFKFTEVMPMSPLDSNGSRYSNIAGFLKQRLLAKGIALPDTLIIEFIVEINGTVSHINIQNNKNKELLQEITYILNSTRRWQPGKQQGIFVRNIVLLRIN